MEGTAQSIVSKFGQVLMEELQEIRGVGDKVVHLRDELATMNAALRIISEADHDSVDHLIREWEKQVHDLAYDAEDCIDVYLLGINRPAPLPPPDDVGGVPLIYWAIYHLDRAMCSAEYYYEKLVLQRNLPRPPLLAYDFVKAPPIVHWARYLLARAKHIARYPYDKLVRQRAVAADIKDLLDRTTIVSERRARYGIDRAALPRAACFASVSVTSVSANAIRPADDPDQFVGLTEQANALANKIKAPVHEGLNVLSIVGFGGLGKTTLAMELCRQLDVDFPRQALVSVSQVFDVEKDIKGLLVRVLQQILKEKLNDEETNKEAAVGTTELQIDDVEDLSRMIKELLNKSRCLIVVDDVWSIPAWEAIRIRLLEKNCCSRIIVTTRIEAVAKAASVSEDFVHHMKPLEPEDSEKLFVKRVFGSTEKGTCPNELEKHMKTILKKCGRMPLAIVSIASLLACYRLAEGTATWERVSRSIGSRMESHPTLEGMRQLITVCYDYLPHHLKACMMYLSIFPEAYVIAKDRLLYRWIAEGLVTEKRGLTLLEVAEEYFNELISRNMILLDKFVFKGVEVERCRVHDMILEVMVSKSQESNFVSLVGKQYGGMPHGHGKVRRLSIHDNDQGPEKVEAMKLQHVRSLTAFQRHGLEKLLDRLGEFKLLRILDLEDCKALQDKHLRDVCQLYLLRFLSLRSTNVSKMPDKVGNLEHLETLDIKNTNILNLPRTLTKLSKLERLRCDGWFLPRGLGNMKALREVDTGVLVGDDVPLVAQEIGELPQLQVLSIKTENMFRNSELDEEFFTKLASSLSKTSTLRSLNLEFGCNLEFYHRWGGSSLEFPHLWGESSLEFLHDVSTPPPLLQCLSVRGRINKLPDWISSLTHLTKFEVEGTRLAGDQLFDVLCKLPKLQSVQLEGNSYKGPELVVRPEHNFPVLRILKVDRCPTVLTFEEGSMTKLETLVLRFHKSESEMSVVGLENLENLKEVNLCGKKSDPGMKRAVGQLKTHPRSSQIKVVAFWW